jgi:hypothetical protein
MNDDQIDEMHRILAEANWSEEAEETLVAAARNPESPLHTLFDWDDPTANHVMRVFQLEREGAERVIAELESADCPSEEVVKLIEGLRAAVLEMDRAAAEMRSLAKEVAAMAPKDREWYFNYAEKLKEKDWTPEELEKWSYILERLGRCTPEQMEALLAARRHETITLDEMIDILNR